MPSGVSGCSVQSANLRKMKMPSDQELPLHPFMRDDTPLLSRFEARRDLLPNSFTTDTRDSARIPRNDPE